MRFCSWLQHQPAVTLSQKLALSGRQFLILWEEDWMRSSWGPLCCWYCGSPDPAWTAGGAPHLLAGLAQILQRTRMGGRRVYTDTHIHLRERFTYFKGSSPVMVEAGPSQITG